MQLSPVFVVVGALIGLYLLYKSWARLQLSRAKHPSLRGHAKWSRRIARLVPYFNYDETRFFCSDGAPVEISHQRRQAFFRLATLLREQSPRSQQVSDSLEESLSDLRFTNAYRVPFPYRDLVAKHLRLGAITENTAGVKIQDIDGNWFYDLGGSYGVNVFGYDFYKECLRQGWERVKTLGPVLGPYHPFVKDNVDRLKSISGLDEVSFHMSGTEAVMQAVRLARYHTGRTHLVRFCGAYHGWWDGVQPGIGNQRMSNDVYTLADMSENTLSVLESRNDIACILINPLQALHPNADASSDASLVDSSRAAHFDKEAYCQWLRALRDVCTRRNIVLILDEVFTGFRLAYRGAQAYYGVQADIVTYGKTLGGGLPVGVVCGKSELMRRFLDNQPANISFARGTFNSHPYVMATMNEFLCRVEQPEYQSIYANNEALWDNRVALLNERLREKNIPVRIENLSSIWTVLYTQPCRYNWLLQYYLRLHGLMLSWIGSGRIIMSLNFSEEDFDKVVNCFISAATQMKADGWWWHVPHLTNKSIKKQMLREMVLAHFPVLKKFGLNDRIQACPAKAPVKV